MSDFFAMMLAVAGGVSLTGVALVFFIGSFTPGPNNLILLMSGSRVGFWRTFPQVWGIVVGVATLLVLQGYFLAELFERLPWTYLVLRVLFTLFLLWLAWKVATSDPMERGEQKGLLFPIPFGFWRSYLFQAINPKAWVIVGTIITNYSSGDADVVALEAVVMAVVSMPLSLLSASLWSLFGVGLRGWLGDARRARIFNVTMAGLLVVALALSFT
ncbi:MAG: LysE family translocator [Alphaproteobacteria bacterium]|nr:LysE family translocator [Alphaproteobacteria bacterium]MDA7984300.1 LysE family translocator [Alphaproteobacteria bacterium]MDA7987133.1 LysE family translocator [Alphaproteobacteria bacterium]MDA7988521.1 LysE family translocator [Alphaproteobacteria bacterium]MDA8001193.1 LysE family translocator [Alphaproteobacteria bacterium]